jgi:chorismate dehydratase
MDYLYWQFFSAFGHMFWRKKQMESNIAYNLLPISMKSCELNLDRPECPLKGQTYNCLGDTMKKIRFGCHDFLNSKPILAHLMEKKIEWLEIVKDSPARLAEMLKCRDLDLSFIPSIEYADDPEYRLVKGISISSHKKVKTVLLISKKAMKDIQTVGTDFRSRSSITLLKLLFMERQYRLPYFNPMEPNLDLILAKNDAALIIGDEAFKIRKANGFRIHDLSNEWYQITGKPFVHAVLCSHINNDIRLSRLINEIFVSLRNLRNGGVDSIASNSAAELCIEKSTCIEYLTNTIKYTFSESEIDSLKTFLAIAERHKIIEMAPDLNFYGE